VSEKEREKKRRQPNTNSRSLGMQPKYMARSRSTWAPFSGATLLQTFIFIQRYVKIVLFEWHEHTHSFVQGQIEILRQTHRTNYFHPPSAFLGRALFIHEAMHHTGLRHLAKWHFRIVEKMYSQEQILKIITQGIRARQSQTPIAVHVYCNFQWEISIGNAVWRAPQNAAGISLASVSMEML